MTADREPEQVGFRLQALAARRLVERESGQLFQAGRWNEPALPGLNRSPVRLQEMLGLPELSRARFAEFIEGADANHRFEFFAGWSDPVEEVSHRSE